MKTGVKKKSKFDHKLTQGYTIYLLFFSWKCEPQYGGCFKIIHDYNQTAKATKYDQTHAAINYSH